MTALQINRFKELLEAKRAELVQGVERHRERLAISDSADPMDRVRTLAERDLTLRQLDLKLALLRRVTGALREIEEGTFGRCAACDRTIPLKRLEAVPWSPYCITCQQISEARKPGPYGMESEDAGKYAMAS
jgi:DnaK suppressor protein